MLVYKFGCIWLVDSWIWWRSQQQRQTCWWQWSFLKINFKNFNWILEYRLLALFNRWFYSTYQFLSCNLRVINFDDDDGDNDDVNSNYDIFSGKGQQQCADAETDITQPRVTLGAWPELHLWRSLCTWQHWCLYVAVLKTLHHSADCGWQWVALFFCLAFLLTQLTRSSSTVTLARPLTRSSLKIKIALFSMLHLVYGMNSPLIFASLVRHSLLHFHLSHMAVHHHLLHHLHDHHLHLLLHSFSLSLWT